MRKRRRKTKKRVWSFLRISLFFVFFLSILGVFLFFSPRISLFRIDRIDVSSREGDTYYEESVKEFVEDFLDKKILSVFPRESIFLARLGLRRELSKSFPPLTDFTFSVNTRTLSITFGKRKEVLVVCSLYGGKSDAVERKKNNCFFGDENGFLFRRAPELSDSLFLTVYAEESPELGTYFLDEKKLSLLLKLVSDLESKVSHHVQRILLPSELTERSFVVVQFDELFGRSVEYPVSLFLPFPQSEEDIEEDVEKLSLLRQTELFQKEFFQEEKALDSIDFRIPHQIRYKIRTEQEKEKAYEQE